jgi:hypothetical protein
LKTNLWDFGIFAHKKKLPNFKFTVYEYELLALHDHLNRATVELVKLTSELLRHFDDAESEMWQQKRFVIWAIVEEIFKPLLRNVGDKIGPHPPYNFNAFMRYIENELKIPNGWIDLEKHTVGFDLLQSQVFLIILKYKIVFSNI